MISHSTITSQALAPLQPRSGPTEQSRLLSPLPGTAMRAKRIHHDRTWGSLFSYTNLCHLPSPCSFTLQWEKLLLSFPHFHPGGAAAASAQAESLWKSKARSGQDSGAVTQSGVTSGSRGLCHGWRALEAMAEVLQ